MPKRLDSLLEFLGYPGLNTQEIESAHPSELMSRDRFAMYTMQPEKLAEWSTQAELSDPILSVRFFSPKTTDVSGKQNPRKYSWRKLVRLKAMPKSKAATRGTYMAYILTNQYESDLSIDPFSVPTPYFQVILTMRPDAAWPWPACFFVFGPVAERAERRAYAETSWDAITTESGTADTRYYVCRSCIQCHGAATTNAKLQYLDSDHWQDRVMADDDFAAVGTSAWPALFDIGGAKLNGILTSDEILNRLNAEIVIQNRMSDRIARMKAPDQEIAEFQSRAAENWVRLHRGRSGHIRPAERGMPSTSGVNWDSSNPNDTKLLGFLNRYCFRCHSSVAYHVFDKQAVVDRRELMVDFIKDGFMPQDRILADDDPNKVEMIRLLENLK